MNCHHAYGLQAVACVSDISSQMTQLPSTTGASFFLHHFLFCVTFEMHEPFKLELIFISTILSFFY